MSPITIKYMNFMITGAWSLIAISFSSFTATPKDSLKVVLQKTTQV